MANARYTDKLGMRVLRKPGLNTTLIETIKHSVLMARQTPWGAYTILPFKHYA